MALYSQAHRPSWLIDIVFYLGRGEDKILDQKKRKKETGFVFFLRTTISSVGFTTTGELNEEDKITLDLK